MFQTSAVMSVDTMTVVPTDILAVNSLIIGDITNNMILISAHYKVTEFLKSNNVYDSYFDIVQSSLRTPSGDPDDQEIVELEAFEEAISQVILFDIGEKSVLDIGICVAPFLNNGMKCILYSNRTQDIISGSPHELLSIINLGE